MQAKGTNCFAVKLSKNLKVKLSSTDQAIRLRNSQFPKLHCALKLCTVSVYSDKICLTSSVARLFKLSQSFGGCHTYWALFLVSTSFALQKTHPTTGRPVNNKSPSFVCFRLSWAIRLSWCSYFWTYSPVYFLTRKFARFFKTFHSINAMPASGLRNFLNESQPEIQKSGIRLIFCRTSKCCLCSERAQAEKRMRKKQNRRIVLEQKNSKKTSCC